MRTQYKHTYKHLTTSFAATFPSAQSAKTKLQVHKQQIPMRLNENRHADIKILHVSEILKRSTYNTHFVPTQHKDNSTELFIYKIFKRHK